MKHRIFLLALLLTLSVRPVLSQDLLDMLDEGQKEPINYTAGTFKATHIVIGQSAENTPKGNMEFLISHHFGRINGGYQNLYGLNQAFIRIGTEYGFTDWLTAGVGLNTYRITWDGYLKAKFLRQSTGGRKVPVTMTGFASMAVSTTTWTVPEQTNYFSSRMSYAFELMIARKFTEWLSLQVTPALVHYNLVATASDHNDIFGVAVGGRIKLSKRVSANAEWYYVIPNQVYDPAQIYHNSLSVGVDIETGGHVFQIFLTNSEGLIEEYFIPYTKGKWSFGDIYLGFTISRMLTIVKPKM
jgi:hypothetical protein